LAVGWFAGQAQSALPTPAEAIAMRFPAEWDSAPPPSAATPAWQTGSHGQVDLQYSLLDPHPTYTLAATETAYARARQSELTVIAEPVVALAARDVRAEAVPIPPIKPRSKAAPKPTFLNDAQIASIKDRLNLTSDQERYWPAVEAALREIAYQRNQQLARVKTAPRGNPAEAIDPNSRGVQQLKSAAVPLVLSFSEEQRQEVRNLAPVIGLGKLASQF
jgi:hypothetical protein